MPDESDSQGTSGYIFALSQLATAQAEMGKELRAGFADLRARLDSKVDKADMAALRSEVEQIERSKNEAHRDLYARLTSIERQEERETGRREATEYHRASLLTSKQKVAAAVGSVALIAATFFGPLLTHAVH